MNSEQRRAARRKRREEKRAQAKAERVKACTLETVADLNSLCKASKQAARGVMWKASTQRYMKDYLRNAVKSRNDLLEGRDICRGFIRFDLWERGKLRHISAVHFPERVIQKSLSQNALVPAIVPTLITANSANIKGRGTDYALKLLKRHLAVMDSTATSLSMDNHIPVLVFALKDPENIIRALRGEKIGTIVKED